MINDLFLLLAVRPTSLAILAKPKSVPAEKELEVVCQALGGYPPPKLTWWLGSKKLRAFDEVSTVCPVKHVLSFS